MSDSCQAGCKGAAKVIATSSSSPVSEDAQQLCRRKEVFTYSCGGQTLIFRRFAELHRVFLPAQFNDTSVHCWKSHSPVLNFFWPKKISKVITAVCLPAVGIPTVTVKQPKTAGGAQSITARESQHLFGSVFTFHAIDRLAQVETMHFLDQFGKITTVIAIL